LAARNALQAAHHFVHFAELLDDRARVREHFGARWRQINFPAELLEQGQAGVLLQLFDLGSDGGLRLVQLVGRAREAQMPGARFEDLELAQGSIFHG
jgi:hypothetical protein